MNFYISIHQADFYNNANFVLIINSGCLWKTLKDFLCFFYFSGISGTFTVHKTSPPKKVVLYIPFLKCWPASGSNRAGFPRRNGSGKVLQETDSKRIFRPEKLGVFLQMW